MESSQLEFAALAAAVEPVGQVFDKLAVEPAFVGTVELVSAVAAAVEGQQLVELAGSSMELTAVATKHQQSSMKLMMRISKFFRSSMRS